MKTKFLLIALVAGLSGTTALAQRMSIDGNLNFLKDVDNLNVTFDYSDMGVGKYEHEDEYLNDRVAKRNEKEPGAGDKWKQAWYDDREERFEPKFLELLNKYLEDEGIKATKENVDASITVLVKTTFTEPGFNVGVMRKPAFINAEVIFIDKASGETKGSIQMNRVPGRDAMGFDFDTGYRLQEAYAKLGKDVGKYLVKKVL